MLGAFLAIVAWATASPAGSSPDEDFHLASIWCPAPLDGRCETRPGPDGWTEAEAPVQVISSAVCFAFQNATSAACADGLADAGTAWTSRLDDGQYPGGFYRVMHVLVGDDVGASVVTMRIANGILAIGVFAAIALLSTAQVRRVLAYGYLVVSVPMIIYLVASVNPSGWSITGVAGAWAGMHGFVTQTVRRKRIALAVLAVFSAVLAATSRGDAGAYLGVIAAATVAMHFGTFRARLRELALPALVAVIGIIGFLAAGQSAALTGGMEAHQTPGDRALLLRNVIALPSFLLGAQTESLNWLDTPVPALTWVPIVLVAGALMLHGLGVLTWPKGIALLGLVGVFVVLPLLLFQVSGVAVGSYVQARYTVPLVPVILAAALWDPVRGRVERLSTTQTAVAFGALTVGHSAVLHVQIRRFVTGLDVGGLNLNYAVEWWDSPVSPMATWLLGSLGFALLAASLFAVRRPHDGEDLAGEVPLPVATNGSLPA